MKKSLKLIVLISFIFSGYAVSAQNTLKVGHVSLEEIVSLMPDSKSVETAVKTKSDELQKQLDAMMTEFNKLAEELDKNYRTYSESTRASKEQELMSIRDKVMEFRQNADAQLEQFYNEKMQPVVAKARKAIQDVGAENGFTYIIESGAFNYKSPMSDDVTSLVKKKLGII